MTFIIANEQISKHKLFLKNKSIVYLESLCVLKRIKDKNNIIIIDSITIDDEGIVEGLDYFFEEILISININAIITNNVNRKLIEICEFHKVPLIVI